MFFVEGGVFDFVVDVIIFVNDYKVGDGGVG